MRPGMFQGRFAELVDTFGALFMLFAFFFALFVIVPLIAEVGK